MLPEPAFVDFLWLITACFLPSFCAQAREVLIICWLVRFFCASTLEILSLTWLIIGNLVRGRRSKSDPSRLSMPIAVDLASQALQGNLSTPLLHWIEPTTWPLQQTWIFWNVREVWEHVWEVFGRIRVICLGTCSGHIWEMFGAIPGGL